MNCRTSSRLPLLHHTNPSVSLVTCERGALIRPNEDPSISPPAFGFLIPLPTHPPMPTVGSTKYGPQEPMGAPNPYSMRRHKSGGFRSQASLDAEVFVWQLLSASTHSRVCGSLLTLSSLSRCRPGVAFYVPLPCILFGRHGSGPASVNSCGSFHCGRGVFRARV